MATAEVTEGMIEAARGSPDAAERLNRAAELGLRMGNRSLQARAWLALSDVERDPAAAAEAVRRVLRLCEGSGLVHLLVLALAREAELAMAHGRADEADESSRRAVEMLGLSGSAQGSEERVFMARAAVLERTGRSEEAGGLIAEAARSVHAKAERIEDPRLRQCFLDLPPNPAVLAAAEGTRRESVP